MTTFEITITILAVLGILMVGLLIKLVNTVGHILLNIIGDVGVKNAEMISATNGHLANIQQQLNNIEDNILDDLRDIRLAEKLDKFELPPDWPWASCCLPNGICPNPYRDCINCPRRGEGGTWSTTSNKVETTNKD